MARPNSGTIDSAVISRLQSDATLLGLMPDGVWFNLAPPGKTRFVLVALLDAFDEGVFQHRGIEDFLYSAKAVALSTATTLSTMKAAAHRIDELLELAPLAPPDFSLLECVREERLADTVPDPHDQSLMWFHFGGQYRVRAAWPDTVSAGELHDGD